MTKIITTSKICFFLFLICLSAPVMAQTIAVADADFLMNESKAGLSIKEQLKSKKEAYKKEFQDTQSEFQEQEKELLSKRESLPVEEFQSKAQEFTTKLAKEEVEFKKKRAELDASVQKALAELQAKIGETIQVVAKEKNVDFVMPKQGLLYAAAGQIDLTQDVLEKLNKEVTRIEIQSGK